MSEDKESTGEKNQAGNETPHKHVTNTVVAIAFCAFLIFFFGAGMAPWPAAIAVCGLSAMGVGVAYFMLRRG